MSFLLEKPEDFKYIHRIFNTNIDGKRTVVYALRGIKGIGRRFGNIICKVAKINPKKRAGELTEVECEKIADVVKDPLAQGIPKWFLNR